GPDGTYANPGAGLTYTDCLLLLGKWRPDGTLAWTASDRVAGDPQRTTRGMIEPTIAELDDGRILMVMRGSNDVRPEWPGHRWCAFSADGGLTWSRPEPWRFQGGEAFFSPSSCSQLIPLADGRLFWMGNISPENPRGNAPRYPLVLGEVDRKSGWLRKETLAVIDDRQPEDSPHLTLSNFFVREDRASGGLALHLTRLFARDFRLERRPDFTADALLYRIDVSV
ncbi:MAG: exo-alpha-sialidase, partial [Lentisphaerae bacterium]|nr:exo-alpha-sialidase [Lentisphaerota bacterium]